MGKPAYSINLLHSDEKSFWDKFFVWALTTGRLLVILTETVALSAFIYRFTLDQNIVDLHDKIKQKQLIVGSLHGTEDQARELQTRLAVSKTLDTQSQQTVSLTKDLFQMAVAPISITNLTMSPKDISLIVTAPSITALGAFVEKLKTHPQLTKVSIDKVENKTALAVLSVSITASLKTPGKTL